MMCKLFRPIFGLACGRAGGIGSRYSLLQSRTRRRVGLLPSAGRDSRSWQAKN